MHRSRMCFVECTNDIAIQCFCSSDGAPAFALDLYKIHCRPSAPSASLSPRRRKMRSTHSVGPPSPRPRRREPRPAPLPGRRHDGLFQDRRRIEARWKLSRLLVRRPRRSAQTGQGEKEKFIVKSLIVGARREERRDWSSSSDRITSDCAKPCESIHAL
jgi:hypothetical protein